MSQHKDPKSNAVRNLNDRFRKGDPYVTGRVVLTSGIQSICSMDGDGNGKKPSNETLEQLLEKVRTFDEFTEDNDPYGEHDFGAFTFEGDRVFWKIDYYAPDLIHGAEDPSDPKDTIRVLTILLAEEY